MGALSTLVEVNKFKSVVYNKIVNRAQLGRASAEDNISQYWQLISGHCLFGLLDEEIINMIEGDLVFIPHGSAHWIADKAISIRIPAAEYTKAKMAGIPPIQARMRSKGRVRLLLVPCVSILMIAVFAASPAYIACYSAFKLSSGAIAHAERRLFIGFACSAFMAWKLTVINVMNIAPNAVTINSHHATSE